MPELDAVPARFGLHFDRADALPDAELVELEPLVLNLSHDRQALLSTAHEVAHVGPLVIERHQVGFFGDDDEDLPLTVMPAMKAKRPKVMNRMVATTLLETNGLMTLTGSVQREDRPQVIDGWA